jgi:hypothetical protein
MIVTTRLMWVAAAGPGARSRSRFHRVTVLSEGRGARAARNGAIRSIATASEDAA